METCADECVHSIDDYEKLHRLFKMPRKQKGALWNVEMSVMQLIGQLFPSFAQFVSSCGMPYKNLFTETKTHNNKL